jgi:hypothetical protein
MLIDRFAGHQTQFATAMADLHILPYHYTLYKCYLLAPAALENTARVKRVPTNRCKLMAI